MSKTLGQATSAPVRRTQRERREATIAKLVQATISAIVEVGHARTSVNEICERAAVSHGGLFRHFDTREDLLVAASTEVAGRQLAEIQNRLTGTSLSSEQGFASAVAAIRDVMRGPMNAVFHELFLAARTNERLAEKLRPACSAHYQAIYRLARDLLTADTDDTPGAEPGAEAPPGTRPYLTEDQERSLEVVLFAVMQMFAGETISRVITTDPVIEDARLRWITTAARAALRQDL